MSIRITEMMPGQLVLSGLNNLENELLREQQQLASGQTISEPSNNPVGTSQVLSLNAAKAWNAEWTAATQTAKGFMQTASTALGQVLSELQTASTLATQAMSGSVTSSDMKAMAVQAKGIEQSLQALGNTQYGSQYVFGGTLGRAPVTPGNPPTVVSSTTPLEIQVGHQIEIPVSVSAGSVFGNGTTTGALAAVQGLVTDLQSGTAANLGHDLTNLQNSINQVTAVNASLGANMDRVQAISSQLSSASVNFSSQLGQVDSTNVPQVMESLSQNQAVFQAALDVGAKMMLPTLANVLSQIG